MFSLWLVGACAGGKARRAGVVGARVCQVCRRRRRRDRSVHVRRHLLARVVALGSTTLEELLALRRRVLRLVAVDGRVRSCRVSFVRDSIVVTSSIVRRQRTTNFSKSHRLRVASCVCMCAQQTASWRVAGDRV